MKRRLLGLLASLLVGMVSLLGPSSAVWAADPQQAVFAGGCFWCLEHDLEVLPGVISAESGYSGGRTANPTYQQVSSGRTGHAESVLVRFDPDRISYATLLRAFWRNVDPVDGEGQFCDCLLYTSPSPRDATLSRMPSSA